MAAVFTPVEEVQPILVVPWDMVEKGARDLFREGWMEEVCLTLSWVGLGAVVVVVLMDGWSGGGGGGGGYSGGAVGVKKMIPVGEAEELTTLENISKMNVVIKQLGMVR